MNQPIANSKANGNLRWILISIFAGLIAGVLIHFAFHTWILSIGAFVIIGVIVYWHNPKWIYRRAFATFSGLTVGVGALFNFDIEGTILGTYFHISSDSINPTMWFATCAIICLALVFLDEKGILEKWIERDKTTKQSFQSFIDQIDQHTEEQLVLDINSSRRFWYKADLFSFVGREIELEQLAKFCEREGAISWFAITGRGGLGKSRLAYKFVKESLNDWKKLFIDWSDFTEYGCLDFEHFEYKSNLFIVIDYVSKDAESIGKWLRKICTQNNRSNKIRVLFLQREGITKTKIGELNFPVWYDQLLIGADKNEMVRHLLYKNTFLALPKLSKEQLKEIICNYIEKNEVAAPTEEELNKLIESLQEIDTHFQRPIYALFLADAWIENSDKVLEWKVNNLQEWLNTHEIKKINNAFKGKKKAQSALQLLLTLATALEKVDITTLTSKPLEDSVSTLTKFSNSKQISLTKLIRSMDLYSESEEDGIILHGIVPDIMGEYYCLTYLKQLSENNDVARLNAFIQTVWEVQHSKAFTSFLKRCINDFKEHAITKWLLSHVPKEEESISEYSSALSYLCARQNITESEKTQEKLKELYTAHPLDKVFFNYTYSIAIRLFELDETNAQSALHEFESLLENHPLEEVAILYSKVVVHLAYTRKNKEAARLIEKLKQLSVDYSSDQILIQYSRGLVNLCAEQDIEDAVATVELLKNLSQENSINEIHVEYAKGLVNICSNQDQEEALKGVEEVKLLTEKVRTEEMLGIYASGLVNLSSTQNADGAVKTVAKLEQLSVDNPTNEMLVQYAKGLVLLSLAQDISESVKTVDKIEELSKRNPSDDLFIMHAKGLTGLTITQSGKELNETLHALKLLSKKHPIDDVVALYATGLLKLSDEQEIKEATETVAQIKQLSIDHPISDMFETYAKGLVRLSNDQRPEMVAQTVDELKQLSELHPSHELFLDYAKGLVNLTTESDEEGIMHVINQVKEFTKDYPSNEMFTQYARVLVNLATEQTVNEAKKTVDQIQNLTVTHPTEEMFLEYSKGLLIISLLENEKSASSARIDQIRKLAVSLETPELETIILLAEEAFKGRFPE